MLLLKQNNTIHRDLKPANICYKNLANGQFRIIFIDFGLAEKNTSLNNKIIAGTPLYMAPELFQGQESTYASDMYALGAIFGEILGAKNIFKFKRTGFARGDLHGAKASLCFEGMFSDYDVSHIDPDLLNEIVYLLQQLSAPDPANRPTIEVLNKFIVTLWQRIELYKELQKEWLQTEQLLNNNLASVKPEWRTPAMSPPLLVIPKTKPHAHYELAKKLVERNCIVDLDGIDNPYVKLKETTLKIKGFNEQFAGARQKINQFLDQITKTSKFDHSNSSGIKKIRSLLKSEASPFEKLRLVHEIGKEKIKNNLSNRYSRSHFFGKGRHKNMEFLYQKLATIDLTCSKESNQKHFVDQVTLTEIERFISKESFTHDTINSKYTASLPRKF